MSAITPRLTTLSTQAASGASTSSAGQTSQNTREPAYEKPEATAYDYARVQHQVWQWKPNDTGLDMP